MKNYISQILLKDIPAYLTCKLIGFAERASLWNASQPTSQEKVDVYDILDCGPLNRFTVVGSSFMIVHNCQSTGHDSHMLFQALIGEYLTTYGFDWRPWHMDLHDCSIFAVHKSQAEAACQLLSEQIYPTLNKMLGGEIALRGEPNICRTWADDKDEERKWKQDREFVEWLGEQQSLDAIRKAALSPPR